MRGFGGVAVWLLFQILTLPAVAASAGPRSFLFDGIAAAQAALLGVWLGAGRSSLGLRLGTTLIGLAALGGAIMLDPEFNPWDLLLLTLRIPILAGVFLVIRGRNATVLTATPDSAARSVVQLRLRDLFLLTFLVALFFGGLLNGPRVSGPLAELLMWLVIVLYGAGFALISLFGCIALLGRRSFGRSLLLYLAATLVVGAALAGFAYSQTSHWSPAQSTALRVAGEALFLAG